MERLLILSKEVKEARKPSSYEVLLSREMFFMVELNMSVERLIYFNDLFILFKNTSFSNK